MLGLLLLLLATPMAAMAQGAPSAASGTTAAASPRQGAATSASPAQAAGAAQSPATAPSAAGSAAPTGSVAGKPQAASPAAASTGPAVRGVPTPVGGNVPKESQEPLPYFAYLLIIMGAIWFFAAIAGIVRLMSRPPSGAYAAAIPEPEKDRPFLSFIMPFGALITVAIIVTIWGVLFLETSHMSELYPLAIDLFVVCLVMLIATMAALRGGAHPAAEVH